jgi:hypothetical protein
MTLIQVMQMLKKSSQAIRSGAEKGAKMVTGTNSNFVMRDPSGICNNTCRNNQKLLTIQRCNFCDWLEGVSCSVLSCYVLLPLRLVANLIKR